MAGTALAGQLISRNGVSFITATKRDDSAIRRLLHESPMQGSVSLAFEREPCFFDGTGIAGAEDLTILAFEDGRLVCMGRCTFRELFLNGTPTRTGYLSELRLHKSAEGRFDILRRGYRFFQETCRGHHAKLYFTSIGADNQRSIQFLQRCLRGMPVYRPLVGFTTVLIPVSRSSRKLEAMQTNAERCLKGLGVTTAVGSEGLIGSVVDCLNSHAERHNLAAVWSEEKFRSLQRHGLPLENFQLLMRGSKLVACAALWDQRGFRQTIIRGYASLTSLFRPWINALSRLGNAARLPQVGEILAHASLSPLALAPGEDALLIPLVEMSLGSAARHGLEFISLGFSTRDPRLHVVRTHFRCIEYGSRLYRVDWADSSPMDVDLDEREILPEVALL